MTGRPAAIGRERGERLDKLLVVDPGTDMVAIPAEGIEELRERQARALEAVAKGAP